MSEEERWDIPDTWKWATAENFARVVGGGTPANAKDPGNYSGDGTPWITPADLSGYVETHIGFGRRNLSAKGLASSSARIMPKGTVLLSSRAPVGYCAVAANDICTNQGFKSLTLDSDEIQPEFLRYYLLGSKSYLESQASGTTFVELSGERVKELLFPIAPRPEQARIVSKIDELFSSIDEGERALERVRKLVERYRQSVLKAAVTGELTRAWREQHAGELESGEALLTRILEARRQAWEQSELAKIKAKGITPADNAWKNKYEEPIQGEIDEQTQLPHGWTWASLSQLAWSSGYGTSEKCGYQEGGLPVLRIPNIRLGRIDLTDIKRAISDLGILRSDLVAIGDLLTIRTNGSPSILGIGTVIREQPLFECYFASYAIRFRLVLKDELADWINFCWQTSLVRSFVDRRKATSAGQYNISQSSLFELCLPIPPVSERRVIVALIAEALSKADNALLALENELRRSVALRQSVLKVAFCGQLVPQDPTDEPASVLLERIAAQRAAAPKRVSTKQPRAKKTKAKAKA